MADDSCNTIRPTATIITFPTAIIGKLKGDAGAGRVLAKTVLDVLTCAELTKITNHLHFGKLCGDSAAEAALSLLDECYDAR